jgi:YesN/AraC family two-component response regulator
MLRLLVVDDDTAVRDTLCSCFPWDLFGFTVDSCVDNGLEAVAYLADHDVDAVLCDIKMPKMDGLQFAEWLSQQNRDIEIALVSGFPDFAYAKKAMSLGVRFFVVKPASYAELAEVCTQLRQLGNASHNRYQKGCQRY